MDVDSRLRGNDEGEGLGRVYQESIFVAMTEEDLNPRIKAKVDFPQSIGYNLLGRPIEGALARRRRY